MAQARGSEPAWWRPQQQRREACSVAYVAREEWEQGFAILDVGALAEFLQLESQWRPFAV